MVRPRKTGSSARSKSPRDAGSNGPIRVGATPEQNASPGYIPNTLAQLQDVHPDTLDFRDKPYASTLVEVAIRRTVQEYFHCFENYLPELKGPVLDQGQEGACTGFGLAAVANYLLWCRQIVQDGKRVSPRKSTDASHPRAHGALMMTRKWCSQRSRVLSGPCHHPKKSSSRYQHRAEANSA